VATSIFDDLDLAPVEPKAHWHFDPEMTGALDLYLHGSALPRRSWWTKAAAPAAATFASAREYRRLMQKGVVVDLLNEEIRHVSARDEPA
jgi:hypothetical protein